MARHRDPTVNLLERTARRLIAARTPRADAVREITAITDDPTVLGLAAGRALGRWEVIPLFHSLGQDVAALLIRAGADREVVERTAETTAHRLRTYLRRD